MFLIFFDYIYYIITISFVQLLNAIWKINIMKYVLQMGSSLLAICDIQNVKFMRGTGFEPAKALSHCVLSAARLTAPAHPQEERNTDCLKMLL